MSSLLFHVILVPGDRRFGFVCIYLELHYVCAFRIAVLRIVWRLCVYLTAIFGSAAWLVSSFWLLVKFIAAPFVQLFLVARCLYSLVHTIVARILVGSTMWRFVIVLRQCIFAYFVFF